MSERHNIRWDGGRMQALQALLAQGHSPRVVAQRMGISLDAARGRIKKLRREARDAAARAAAAKPSLRAPPTPKNVAGAYNALNFRRGPAPPPTRRDPFRPVRPERFEPLFTSAPRSFEDLAPNRCKWPLGDIMRRELICCGGEAPDGPYCEAHEKMNRNHPETVQVDAYIAGAVKKLAA